LESSFITTNYGHQLIEEQAMALGPLGTNIKDKLTRAFQPQLLDVIDESHLHAGHAGSHPDGESHFRVKIVSQAFAGKSRVDTHRMVNAALADELKSRLHALAIQASAPK
jgi:BolA family transcriptional regulator, general stress-responsive regulator